MDRRGDLQDSIGARRRLTSISLVAGGRILTCDLGTPKVLAVGPDQYRDQRIPSFDEEISSLTLPTLSESSRALTAESGG